MERQQNNETGSRKNGVQSAPRERKEKEEGLQTGGLLHHVRSFPDVEKGQFYWGSGITFSHQNQQQQMHTVRSSPLLSTITGDAFPPPVNYSTQSHNYLPHDEDVPPTAGKKPAGAENEIPADVNEDDEVPRSKHGQDGNNSKHHHVRQISRTTTRQHLILLQGNGKSKTINQQAFIYQAAMKGDWRSVESLLRADPSLATISINENGDRALHVAAATKRTKFVRELVKIMKKEELEIPNEYGNTAFCFAAASGVVKIAEAMYDENKNLPSMRGTKNMTPIYMAALLGNKEMVYYLSRVTPLDILKPKECFQLLEATMNAGLFDVALKILTNAKGSETIHPKKKASLLRILARNPKALTGHNRKYWSCKRFSIPWMRRVDEAIQKRLGASQLLQRLLGDILVLGDAEIVKLLIDANIVEDAVKVGNVEFLVVLFRLYPDLIQKPVGNGHSIFHVAVLHRQENVFNLIYDIGSYRDLIVLSKDTKQNNILHLAGAKPDQDGTSEVVSGAALQMQRELLWFKEVEKIVPPSFLKARNAAKQTPREVFSTEHKRLLEKGEEWMKGTANSCMLVATLIATVVFAAAFTLPGGSIQDTGVPIFLRATWFEVFVISDAVGMFTSTTSIIVFLSILTSRYAEKDFLVSLPTKLMLGLTSLFVAILSMVVAFTSTFFLTFKHQKLWVPRFIGGFACIPVIVFALLQYKLWFDTIRSTYWSRFLFRPSKLKPY